MAASPVGIFCGSGVLPFAVADAVIQRGGQVFLVALSGFADDRARVERYPHRWVGLGQYGAMIKSLRGAGVKDIVFIGGLVRPSLRELRLDLGALRVLPRAFKAYRGGDDHLLSNVARQFESEGFRVLGIDSLAPDVLVPLGELARRHSDERAKADIALALAALRAIGPFDIGQGAVVIDGHIVALEDIEGTDGLLARVKHLRDSGRIRKPPHSGVLVKAPKLGQDMRFDLPTLGPRTIEGAVAAQLAGVAVVAGASIVAEPERLVELADRHDLFVTGLKAAGPS